MMVFGAFTPFIILLIAGVLVWISGTHLALYGDWISDRFKIGRAFTGSLLLALATSLPEVATTITASWIGNAHLTISNLLGGINLQTVILALADLFLLKGALTYFAPRPSLLVAGVFVIIQLSVASIAMAYGELFSIYGVGLWPLLLFCVYLAMLYFILHHEKDHRWVASNVKHKIVMAIPSPDKKKVSDFKLIFLFVINAFLVLVAGWSVAFFVDHLTIKNGWDGNWIGATVVALTTSLPEISTTFGAVRQKAYVLAIANIFGSNVLTISLLFLSDFFFRKGPIINEAHPSSFLLAGVGILITSIFLWGILERKNKTYFRMGLDSCLVLLVYSISMVLLFKST